MHKLNEHPSSRILYPDHKPFIIFDSATGTSASRLQRWALIPVNCNFDSQLKGTTRILNADSLFCLPEGLNQGVNALTWEGILGVFIQEILAV